MRKFLVKYIDIMKEYRAGKFGNDHLTLHEILDKAGEPDLISKMSVSEIQCLIDSSFGMSKHVFSLIKVKKISLIKKMRSLEEELAKLNVDNYCSSKKISASELARNLKLDVHYCDSSELPDDEEATLSPTVNDKFYGVINISQDGASSFSYMHEIIHYLKDVGVGNKVSKTFARKKQGKTDSPEEQDVNYLTAAASMPYNQIITLLDEYENTDSNKEKDFISRIAGEYQQAEDAVLRRFIEVRSLADYQANFSK